MTVEGVTAAQLAGKVNNTGDETIAGIKTFSSQPVLPQKLTQGTAVASTSGTNIDFASIPSWVKRITIAFNGVSTNGANNIQVVLGTGSTPTYTTSGYAGGYSLGNNAIFTAAMSTGFDVMAVAATSIVHAVVTLVNVTGNTWVMSGNAQISNSTSYQFGAGSVSLAAALTAVRVTAGGNTFDAGNINILYE
jgi:hypothetical protein